MAKGVEDQKIYVRAKTATNLKARNGTGGGPNREQKLSEYEQAVFHLIGMIESIGVTAKTFGLETRGKVNKENVQRPENGPVGEGYLQELVIEALYDEPESTSVNNTRQRSYLRPSTSSTKKRTASEAFDEELKTQRELCEAVKRIVEETKEIFLRNICF